MKKIYSVNNSKVVLGLLSGVRSRITSIMPALYQVITPMLFVAFGLFGVNEKAWGQLPYNTTMTSTHYNDSKVKVGSDGESYSQNAWSNGIFLQAGTRKNLWGTIKGEEWNWEDKYVIIALKTNSIPYQLKFKYKCNSIIASNPDWYVAESSDKSNWTTIWSTESNSTSTSALQTVDLSKSTKYIKFCYSGNYGGTYSDIIVTDQAYVHNPQVGDDEISSLDFKSGTISSGKAELSFDVEWCNVSTLSVTSSNTTYFTVSPASFGNTAKYGTQTVTVYYDRDVAVGNNHSGTITISNGNSTYTKTVSVKGTTTKRPQEIHWNASLAAVNYTLNAEESLTGSAIATADKEDAVITYTSSNENVIAVSPDKKTLMAISTGTADITASATGDDIYAAGTDTKTFTVTSKKKQTITWNRNLMGLKTNANPDTVHLNATATSNGTITYSIEVGSDGCITLGGTNNSVMTITGTPGTAYIKATQAGGVIGGEDWIAATAIKQVKVRNPNSSCDEYAISDESFTFSSGDKTSMSEKVFNLTGKPTTLTFKAKRGGLKFLWSEQKDLYIEQYANFGSGLEWRQMQAIKPAESENTYGPYPLEETATKIRFRSGEYAEQQVYNITSARETIFDVSEPSITDDAERNVKWSKTISVTRSNIDVLDISVTSADASCPFQLSKTSLGTDCADMSTETFEVFFTPTTKNKTYTGTITITDGKATNNHTATIPLSVKTVAFNQAITWNFTDNQEFPTTNVPLVFNATTDATGLEVSYRVADEDADKATIDGNTLTIIGSGSIQVIAYQEGDDKYNAAPEITKTIIANKVSPNITNPTGKAIEYRSALKNSTWEEAGVAKVTLRGVPNTVVAGSFGWNDSEHVIMDATGEHSYKATFTPSDGGMYNNVEYDQTITILRTTQSIEMKDGAVKVAVDGIDANKADSKIDLDDLIKSQTSDIVNNNERTGAITYEVISENKANADIAAGNIFSATVIGDYTIRATKAQTDYYNVVTKDFTVTVEKRANTLVTAGPYTKYVDDEVEGVATQVNSDGKIQTSSSDSTVAYYDVANNKIVIPNSEAKSFDQKEITIKIWQDATVRFEGIAETDAKTITLTVKKYDNAFSCSWGSWTKRVNFEDVFDVDFTTNNSDFTNSPVVITQTSGKTIATLVQNDNIHNTITASYNRGDATWNLSQAENYKYKAATKTGVKVEVRVLPAVDCYLYEDDTEHSFKTAITDISGHYEPAVAISGPVKQISFDAKKDLLGVNYFYAQYSVDNGANWRDIANPDLSSSYETYGPYDFPGLQENEKVTHIRFGAKTGATEWKYYKNVKVSRTTSIKPEDKDGNLVETLTMPQNTVGGSTTAKFYMNFSSCDDVIKVVSNDSHFTVDQSEITVDHTKDYNYAEVTVTYTSDAKGTHTGTITIYTKYQYRTFTVTGTTDRKVQTLDWKPGFTDNPMILSVGLTVDNVNIAAEASSGNSVIYSTNNSEVIKITLGGLGFEVVGEGTAELTASAEGDDDVWFPVSETKTVNATGKKIQVILWEQDLMQGLAPEQVIDLTAKVYIRNMQDGSLTLDEERTNQITYSCPDNTAISLNSAAKQITVLDYGQATITANVDGDANYEAALPVTVYVKVRQPSAGCETPLVLDRTEQVQLFSMDMQLSGGFGDWTTPEITSEVILLDAAKGKPDKLSYQHNGELYVYGLIKLCRGTIMAQQRVNGSWSDITGSTYNNEGREGSEGAYDWRLVEDLQLDENADAIRFRRLNAGQGYHNFRNIQITLKQYLRQTNEELDLGDIQIGEARPATIGFDYSDVKGDVWARKANAEDASYVINTSVFEMVCGEHGHKELPITITPTTLGPWSATIIIEDQFTHLPCTLTVKANVVTGISYVFNGSEGEKGTEWGKNTNWEDSNTPGTNDAVLVNSDVVISGNVTVGSMTISDEATVTVTVTGKLNLGSKNSALLGNYGNLHIEEGGEINVGSGALLVNDLILDASLGTTSISAASGQLTDENQKLVLMNKAYFQMSFDPSGQITYGWYDFVVPFEVDIQTGIFREGDTDHHLVPGVDFIVMEHSETARAAGKKDWSVTTGTMLPGRVYTITFDDEVVQNTFLFQKKQGSDLLASDSYQAVCSAGDSDKRGWNGLGNGTMQHKQMKTAGMKVQLYDHTNNVYVTREADDYIFAVGTSFFIQVGGEQEIEFANATNRTIMAPAREARRTVTEFRLALREEVSEHVADHFWVSASEDATGEYVIGHDLLKMGTPTEAKVAQIWATKGDIKLCDIETTLSNDNAQTDLVFFAPQAGTYELNIKEAPENTDLYLTYNGRIIWDLMASPYVFDLTKGTTEGYGLLMDSRAPQIATGIEETNADSQSVRKVLINNTIYIITPEGAMYDVTGKIAK